MMRLANWFREGFAVEKGSHCARCAEEAPVNPDSRSLQPIGSPVAAHDAALAALQELKPTTVLDCPAGEGAFTERLVAAGYRTAASDILPDNFGLIGTECSYCDLNDRIDLESEAFDAVACLNGLHRVWARGRAMKELARVMKPGGHLVLTFVNNVNLLHRFTFSASGSIIYNTLGPPHVNYPEADQPAACFRYPMTLGDVLRGVDSVGLKLRSVRRVGTSWGSVALFPLALVAKLGQWILPASYREHCFLTEANRFRVLFGDYLLVVAEKPRP